MFITSALEMDWTMPPIRKTMPTFTTQTASHEPCIGRQPRWIKVGGGWKATNMIDDRGMVKVWNHILSRFEGLGDITSHPYRNFVTVLKRMFK